MQLWTYVQMPAMALGAAVSAMAAQNIGAGKWERVSAITRSGVVYTVLITGVLIVLLTLADRPVIALFMGGDSPALPIARHIHLLATWNFVLFGVTMVLFGTVRANGAVWAPLIILAIGLVPVRFGWIFGTQHWLGADALWRASRSARSPTSPRHGLLSQRRLEEGAMRVGESADEEECTRRSDSPRASPAAL